jgi:hypothetical protein
MAMRLSNRIREALCCQLTFYFIRLLARMSPLLTKSPRGAASGGAARFCGPVSYL